MNDRHELELRAAETLSRPYMRRLVPEVDGGYSASIPEFPGCYAEGNTADDAMRNLESAAKAWLVAALESGQNIPDPVELGEYSGKIALRIPRSQHRMAVERAAMESISLNQFLVAAVSYYLGACGGFIKLGANPTFIFIATNAGQVPVTPRYQQISNSEAIGPQIFNASRFTQSTASSSDLKIWEPLSA